MAAVAAELPAEAWQALQVREGANGPLVFEFAAVRVWAVRHRKPGPPVWLLIRRSLEAEPEVKYYVSNADAETPLGVLALVACTRHRVEEFFEDGKSYLGMAQYETRSWVGWHHHMTLVALAHLFVTLTRRRSRKKTPELTLDRTVRLLQRAMEDPGLTLALATGAGGLPHPPQRGRPAVAHQDLDGPGTRGSNPSGCRTDRGRGSTPPRGGMAPRGEGEVQADPASRSGRSVDLGS